MYQDFDASEFDYLNSTTPQQFEQQTKTQTPEVTNIERFWNLTGTGENSAPTSALAYLRALSCGQFRL
jgi:hypothetical protein